MSETLYGDGDATLEAGEETLHLRGAPGFHNATALAVAGVEWLERAEISHVSFDACDVGRVSSATLSILLEWLRTSHRRGIEIDRITLSDRIRELVELAELSGVFRARETSFAASSWARAARR